MVVLVRLPNNNIVWNLSVFLFAVTSNAFNSHHQHHRVSLLSSSSSQNRVVQRITSSSRQTTTQQYASVSENEILNGASSPDVASPTLGLLTFDLDDTLYPIQSVIDEANAAFSTAMLRYGFDGIGPNEISTYGKQIREEIAEAEGPEAAAVLTHTEVRTLAIRKAMEKTIFERKLKDCADDWATPVSSLSSIIVKNAKKWSTEAVSSSVVRAVLNAWEMERHHAAERHLYPECADIFAKIRKEHPNVIIGAVTDGKANPLFMTFTLAKYFDFCLSWEDDQGGRSKFFKDLSSVEGNAELKWIYNAALEKYLELSSAKAGLKGKGEEAAAAAAAAANPMDVLQKNNEVWIHVGDDLAYDVGGSAQCGAKTILVELEEEKYKQTARFRFEGGEQPSWSTTLTDELRNRKVMNEAAKPQVSKKIEFLTRLPEAINDILSPEE